MSEKAHDEQPDPNYPKNEQEEPQEMPISPVLARLIEEVRNEKVEDPQAYNRFHNRHNRSR